MKKTTILFVVLCFIATAIGQTTVLRVNPDATGETEDGLTWETAYKTLTSARIDGAGGTTAPANTIEIWVKAGTYAEAPHWMQTRVNVYGGFNGTETALEERDWKTNITTLSPSVANKQVIDAYSSKPNTLKQAVWDGFVITGVSGAAGFGGAVRLNDGNILRNCTITGNTTTNGNGMIYSFPGAVLENCVITNNSTSGNGTINFNHRSANTPYTGSNVSKVINCIIVNNTVGGSGGGIHVGAYNLEVYNTLIANNTASGNNSVGGIAFGSNTIDLNSSIINSTVVNNLGTRTGGLQMSTQLENGINITNSIVAGNRINEGATASNINTTNGIITYTAVEDSLHVGTNNRVITDNQFKNPTSVVGSQVSLPEYDWTLLDSSICINRGDNSVVYGTVDLQGDARIQHDIVDLGAYESDYNKVWTGINKQGVNSFAYYNSINNSLIFQDQVNQVQVFNIQGANILSLNHSSNQIFLPQLPQGVYLVKYRLGEEVQQQKFIVK